MDGGGVAEEAGEEAVDRRLEGLGDFGGEFATVLDSCEGEFGDEGFAEGGGEDAGGGYGVLNGEVDADAAYGGHGVGGIADAEQAREVPALKTIDLNGEEFELSPVGDLVDAVGEEGDETGEGVVEGGKAGGLDVGDEGVLGDDEATLVVVAAGDKDEELAVIEVAEGVLRLAVAAAEAEPEDVDGGSGLVDGEAGGGAGGGVAAVAADNEGGVDFGGAGGGVDVDAGDAGARVDEGGGLVLHEEVEGG